MMTQTNVRDAVEARHSVAELNQSCLCLPIARPNVDARINTAMADVQEFSGLLAERAHLFAATPVFISPADLSAMIKTMESIEAITGLPGYRHMVFERTKLPFMPNDTMATRGVMMGFDFHLTPDGPRLIEVNTNAGGAGLVSSMLRDQDAQQCCGSIDCLTRHPIADTICEMMIEEWRSSGRPAIPRRIAILDAAPDDQYLYPDMVILRTMLQRWGINTVIADPGDLDYCDGELRMSGQPVDMIYNRLTDFTLDDPQNSSIGRAYAADQVVISPAPHHHALYADKRNLITFGETESLKAWGLAETHVAALETILPAVLVTPDRAENLWTERRSFVFKPHAGFGGRAVYRGAKLTRRVWSEIATGGYIAQAYAPPPTRRLKIAGKTAQCKFDIRIFAYGGTPFLMAARLYDGQTTNFRTPGGGFAPVICYRPH